MELLVIAGPTACNKSQIGIKLAKKLNGEIISADSMQIYKHMDIGTAKTKNTEGVTHHLIDIIYPNEPFSVAQYQTIAKKAIKQIIGRGKLPILVGGSGFYINSIIFNTKFETISNNTNYRDYLYNLHNEKGTEYLYNMLYKVDYSYASNNKYNVARIIRGLVFYHQTGRPISSHNEEEAKRPILYNAKVLLLNMERELLYKNINNRVDSMIDEGLVNEVKFLLNKGYSSNLSPLKSIGYKEIVNYINGNTNLNQAIYEIKKNTRNFAKRQLTWFRNKTPGTWVNNDLESILFLIKSR